MKFRKQQKKYCRPWIYFTNNPNATKSWENERETLLKKLHDINKLKPPDRTNEFSFALLNVLHIVGEGCPFYGTKYSIIKVPQFPALTTWKGTPC